MSSWDDRERLAGALIAATKHEETREQRPVRVHLGSDDDGAVVAFIEIGPGGFLKVEVLSPKVEDEDPYIYINPAHVQAWYFADEEH